VLALAVSDGQLTLEEYSERVDVVLGARMQGELTRLASDLQQSRPAVTMPASSVPQAGEPQRIRAVLAENKRRGRWKVPAHLQVRALLGECTLELQSAVLTSHRTVIDAHATLGSITIYVPEGVEVDLSGTAILGSKGSEIRAEPAPGAPIIEIRARAVLGEVTVKHPDLRHQVRDAVERELGRAADRHLDSGEQEP